LGLTNIELLLLPEIPVRPVAPVRPEMAEFARDASSVISVTAVLEEEGKGFVGLRGLTR